METHLNNPLAILNKIPPELAGGGCYQLFLKLSRELRLVVGACHEWSFPPGVYIYTGRHQKNVLRRVERHLRPAKRTFWHIDYLTSNPAFQFLGILVYFAEREECQLNQQYRAFTRAALLFPGFGSTDCKNSCGSHLLFLKSERQLKLPSWKKFYLSGKGSSNFLLYLRSEGSG